ncbi:glycoside hydrolase superfamily, partial [Polychytrium aggregatum]|uniref:glycoside hydrolase superfamily n=1 Tax=Polychytrium aggregatum TaxID=110093 RepID=UPI0022FDCF2D
MKTATLAALLGFSASALANYVDVVSYWGAHPTAGELPLRSYCDLNVYTIIHLSFIDHLSPAGFDSDITQRNMTAIAQDVLYCQSKGIRIGISVGGALGSVAVSSDATGISIANDLWNNFLAGTTPLSQRAIPGVIFDGVDFDIEAGGSGNNGYAAMTNTLRSYIVASGRDIYISAAPQCPIPDANMDYTLRNGWFDFVAVQFYSAPCGLGFSGSPNGPNYADNSSIWDHGAGSWMAQVPNWQNWNAKLMVGFPASSSAGNYGGGDIPTLLKQYVPGWQALNPTVFGGLMWWD